MIMLTLTLGMVELKAQDTQPFAANTGDAELDGILGDVNTRAKADLDAFTNEVSTTYGVPKEKVEQANKTMSPGDVYMAAQVASASKKPFDEVTKSYQANKNKGWGVIAKEMGIKPGSPEFHAMKKSMKTNHGKSKANGGPAKGKSGKEKADKGNIDNGSSGKTNGKAKKK